MPTLNKVFNVAPITQSKSMSCWAAAAAMMLSWKAGLPISEREAARRAGATLEAKFNANAGLPGTEIATLAQALGLTVEAPQNYLPTGYHSLLVAHGPLWIGTAIFSQTQTYKHVRIVRGIIGDGGIDTSSLFIVDPDGGRDYQESVRQFASELEAIAIADLGPAGPGNLSPQIIRFR